MAKVDKPLPCLLSTNFFLVRRLVAAQESKYVLEVSHLQTFSLSIVISSLLFQLHFGASMTIALGVSQSMCVT